MKYGLIGIAVVAVGAMFTLKSNKEGTVEKVNVVDKVEPLSAGSFEPIAVIELFTSQGCSSCPPADRLLAKTIESAHASGKKIFAVSLHVDYWNRLGWPDPFSTAAYTQRQSAYVSSLNLSGAYTPQMVVNGTREFTGSDQNSLSSALSKALNTKAEVSFTKLKVLYKDGKPSGVEYALDGNYAGHNINFALVSLEETTVVKRGENGGSTLKNDNVTRQFITQKAMASGTVELASSPIPTANNFIVIAYVQEGVAGRIVGAAKSDG